VSYSGLGRKVAVVAGGGSGIGAATALRLAVEGCTVVVGDVAVEGAARVSVRQVDRALPEQSEVTPTPH